MYNVSHEICGVDLVKTHKSQRPTTLWVVFVWLITSQNHLYDPGLTLTGGVCDNPHIPHWHRNREVPRLMCGSNEPK